MKIETEFDAILTSCYGENYNFLSKDLPIDDSLYAHILLDSQSQGTKYEGQTSLRTVTTLIHFLVDILKVDRGIILNESIKFKTSTVLHKLTLLVDALNKTTIDEYLEEITSQIEHDKNKYKIGVLLNLGYNGKGCLSGHAIIGELKHCNSDEIRLTVFNSGSGLEKHAHCTTQKGDKYLSTMTFSIKYDEDSYAPKIKKLLKVLAIPIFDPIIDSTKNFFNNSEDYYKLLFRTINELEGSITIDHEYANSLIYGQRSGTCAWKSLMIYLKNILNEEVIYNKIKFFIKLQSVNLYKEHLNVLLEAPNKSIEQIKEINSKLMLLRNGSLNLLKIFIKRKSLILDDTNKVLPKLLFSLVSSSMKELSVNNKLIYESNLITDLLCPEILEPIKFDLKTFSENKKNVDKLGTSEVFSESSQSIYYENTSIKEMFNNLGILECLGNITKIILDDCFNETKNIRIIYHFTNNVLLSSIEQFEHEIHAMDDKQLLDAITFISMITGYLASYILDDSASHIINSFFHSVGNLKFLSLSIFNKILPNLQFEKNKNLYQIFDQLLFCYDNYSDENDQLESETSSDMETEDSDDEMECESSHEDDDEEDKMEVEFYKENNEMSFPNQENGYHTDEDDLIFNELKQRNSPIIMDYGNTYVLQEIVEEDKFHPINIQAFGSKVGLNKGQQKFLERVFKLKEITIPSETALQDNIQLKTYEVVKLIAEKLDLKNFYDDAGHVAYTHEEIQSISDIIDNIKTLNDVDKQLLTNVVYTLFLISTTYNSALAKGHDELEGGLNSPSENITKYYNSLKNIFFLSSKESFIKNITERNSEMFINEDEQNEFIKLSDGPVTQQQRHNFVNPYISSLAKDELFYKYCFNLNLWRLDIFPTKMATLSPPDRIVYSILDDDIERCSNDRLNYQNLYDINKFLDDVGEKNNVLDVCVEDGGKITIEYDGLQKVIYKSSIGGILDVFEVDRFMFSKQNNENSFVCDLVGLKIQEPSILIPNLHDFILKYYKKLENDTLKHLILKSIREIVSLQVITKIEKTSFLTLVSSLLKLYHENKQKDKVNNQNMFLIYLLIEIYAFVNDVNQSDCREVCAIISADISELAKHIECNLSTNVYALAAFMKLNYYDIKCQNKIVSQINMANYILCLMCYSILSENSEYSQLGEAVSSKSYLNSLFAIMAVKPSRENSNGFDLVNYLNTKFRSILKNDQIKIRLCWEKELITLEYDNSRCIYSIANSTVTHSRACKIDGANVTQELKKIAEEINESTTNSSSNDGLFIAWGIAFRFVNKDDNYIEHNKVSYKYMQRPKLKNNSLPLKFINQDSYYWSCGNVILITSFDDKKMTCVATINDTGEIISIADNLTNGYGLSSLDKGSLLYKKLSLFEEAHHIEIWCKKHADNLIILLNRYGVSFSADSENNLIYSQDHRYKLSTKIVKNRFRNYLYLEALDESLNDIILVPKCIFTIDKDGELQYDLESHDSKVFAQHRYKGDIHTNLYEESQSYVKKKEFVVVSVTKEQFIDYDVLNSEILLQLAYVFQGTEEYDRSILCLKKSRTLVNGNENVMLHNIIFMQAEEIGYNNEYYVNLQNRYFKSNIYMTLIKLHAISIGYLHCFLNPNAGHSIISNNKSHFVSKLISTYLSMQSYIPNKLDLGPSQRDFLYMKYFYSALNRRSANYLKYASYPTISLPYFFEGGFEINDSEFDHNDFGKETKLSLQEISQQYIQTTIHDLNHASSVEDYLGMYHKFLHYLASSKVEESLLNKIKKITYAYLNNIYTEFDKSNTDSYNYSEGSLVDSITLSEKKILGMFVLIAIDDVIKKTTKRLSGDSDTKIITEFIEYLYINEDPKTIEDIYLIKEKRDKQFDKLHNYIVGTYKEYNVINNDRRKLNHMKQQMASHLDFVRSDYFKCDTSDIFSKIYTKTASPCILYISEENNNILNNFLQERNRNFVIEREEREMFTSCGNINYEIMERNRVGYAKSQSMLQQVAAIDFSMFKFDIDKIIQDLSKLNEITKVEIKKLTSHDTGLNRARINKIAGKVIYDIDDLMSIISHGFSNNLEIIIQPGRQEAKIELHAALIDFMFFQTSIEHLNRIKDLFAKLHDVPDYNFEFRDNVLQILNQRRYKLPEQQSLLLFEYRNSIFLNHPQILALESMGLFNNNKPRNTFIKLPMGSGKTKVIMPIYAALSALQGNIPIIVVSREMLNTNWQDISCSVSKTYNLDTFILEHKLIFVNDKYSAKHFENHFNLIINCFERAKQRKSIIITTPNVLASLEANFLTAILDSGNLLSLGQIKSLESILIEIKNKGRGVIDEADVNLRANLEHNYALDSGKYILKEKPSLALDTLYLYKKLFEIDAINKHVKREICLSSEELDDIIYKTSSCYVYESGLLSEMLTEVDFNDFELAHKYLTSNNVTSPFDGLNLSTESLHRLGILRYNLTKGLKLCLNKKYNEQYGFRKNSHNIAVPYVSSNTPSDCSEYANFVGIMNLTIQAVLLSPIDLKMFKNVCSQFNEQYKNMKLSSSSDKANGVLYHIGMLLYGIDININEPPMITYEELYPNLKNNINIKLYTLSELILRNIRLINKQLSINPQDIVEMFEVCHALSGTDLNYRNFTPTFQIDKTKFTIEGEVLTNIRSSLNFIKAAGRTQDLETFIRNTFFSDKPISAIIDQGAMLKNYNNYTVVNMIKKHLYTNYRESFDHIIFFDSNNNLQALSILTDVSISINSTTDESLKTINTSSNRIFVFFDQKHCRGADINIDRNATAVLTLDETTTYAKFLQAATRFRKLGRGQIINILIPEDLHYKISDNNVGNEFDTLIKLLIKNESESLLTEHLLSAKQKLRSLFRSKVMGKILRVPCISEKKNLFVRNEELFVRSTSFNFYEMFGGQMVKSDTVQYLEKFALSLFNKYTQNICPSPDEASVIWECAKKIIAVYIDAIDESIVVSKDFDSQGQGLDDEQEQEQQRESEHTQEMQKENNISEAMKNISVKKYCEIKISDLYHHFIDSKYCIKLNSIYADSKFKCISDMYNNVYVTANVGSDVRMAGIKVDYFDFPAYMKFILTIKCDNNHLIHIGLSIKDMYFIYHLDYLGNLDKHYQKYEFKLQSMFGNIIVDKIAGGLDATYELNTRLMFAFFAADASLIKQLVIQFKNKSDCWLSHDVTNKIKVLQQKGVPSEDLQYLTSLLVESLGSNYAAPSGKTLLFMNYDSHQDYVKSTVTESNNTLSPYSVYAKNTGI